MTSLLERLRKWYEAARAASDDAEEVLFLLNAARVRARDNPEQWAFEEQAKRARCETLRAQAERDRWRARAEEAESRISEMEDVLRGLGQ